MELTAPSKAKDARQIVIDGGIDSSLMPLIFHDLDDRGIPPLNAFRQETILTTAANICKLSGLLVQAYWYWLKTEDLQREIPVELDKLLLQVWAGHKRYDELLAASVLQYAAVDSGYSSISKFVRNPNVLYEWGALIRLCKGRLKTRINEFAHSDWYDRFISLIESLPILREVKFNQRKIIFAQGKVPEFPYLYRSNRCRYMMFLHAFEVLQSRPSIVFKNPHSSYTEEVSLLDAPDSRTAQYAMIRQVLGLKKVKQEVLHLFDAYHYIQNLARVIEKTPRDSLKVFLAKFGPVEGLKRSKTGSVVTLILAQHGPSEALKGLLGPNPNLVRRYLKGLEELGVLGEVTAKHWEREYQDRRDRSIASVEHFLELAPEKLKKDLEDRIDLEARCWSVIRAAGLELDSAGEYIESIGMHIQMLESLSDRFEKGKEKLSEVGLTTAKLIERTLKFLISFYSGLNSYYLSFQDDEKNYRRHEEDMAIEARVKYKKVDGLTPGTLVKEFRRVCERANSEMTDKLLGRVHICDLDKFNTLTGRPFSDFADSAPKAREKNLDIIEVINQIKHDKSKSPKMVFSQFLSQTIRLFKFLRDGKELSDKMTFGMRLYQSVPVYPAVVSFREQRRKRDGLVICNYEAYSNDWRGDEDPEDVGIKILSPHEYAPHEQYYCIPFKRKTTPEWLLDPFLVSCDKLGGISNRNDSNDRSKA